MCRTLEMKYNGNLHWDKLDIVEMLENSGISALIVHDIDDREIPFDHARDFKNIKQDIWFHDTQKLGHRRIVQNTQVINRVVEFVEI